MYILYVHFIYVHTKATIYTVKVESHYVLVPYSVNNVSIVSLQKVIKSGYSISHQLSAYFLNV